MKGLNELTGAGTHKCQETGVKVGSHALIRGDLVSRRILDDLNGPNQTRTRIQGYLISQDNPPSACTYHTRGVRRETLALIASTRSLRGRSRSSNHSASEGGERHRALVSSSPPTPTFPLSRLPCTCRAQKNKIRTFERCCMSGRAS